MKSQHWPEIESLYYDLVDLDPREREARLASISDHDLRREVLSLLQAGSLSPAISAALKEGRVLLLDHCGTPTSSVQDEEPRYADRLSLTFTPGDLLAERYRILEFLGHGGMGEVYEAEDLELSEKIAIKVIRLNASLDKEWRDRFRSEVQLARRITHPNVCRIFDIERYQQGQREVLFLTMEMIRGETLTSRLKNNGKLDISDAFPIAIQLCSALNAAHQAGVLHRDLKCGNVMLVGSGHDVRAVVTDFGTARLLDSVQNSIGTATQQSAILGTPAYMSPEQLEGKNLTPASDIYSLGLVLYEMITGIRPFHAESPWAEAIKRTREMPEPPAKVVQGLPENWDLTILRCLERTPSRRFSSAQEVGNSLQGVEKPASSRNFEKLVNTKAGTKMRVTRLWKFAALLLPLLAILLVLSFRTHPTLALTEKDVVVLADFTNKTGEQVFDSTLREALAIDLEQSPFLNILSDLKIGQTLKLMRRPRETPLPADLAQEVCIRSNSRALVAGSIARLGSHYAILLRATDCHTGDVIGSAEAEADSRENTLHALGRAAAALRSKLGESLASVKKFDKPLPEVTTSSLDALQAYSEGLRMIREKGDPDAIPFLQHAVNLDPNFALGYVKLGLLYFNTRQAAQYIECKRKAFALREHVSDREGYEISGGYYFGVTSELPKALQQYKVYVQEYPRNSYAHLSLGFVYLLLGQYEDAAKEENEALRLDPDGGNSYTDDLAYAYIALNRFEQAEDALQKTLHRTPDALYPHVFSYMLAFLRNDPATMEQQLAWAKGRPGVEGALLFFESAHQAYYGHLIKAVELNAQGHKSDEKAFSKSAAADLEAVDAIRYAGFGYRQEARRSALAALAHGASAHTSIASSAGNSFALATLALARSGATLDAQRAAETLSQQAPLDTLVQEFWLPTIRAEIEIANGHPSAAIELLRNTLPYELNDAGAMASAYTRGRAFLALGNGSGAAGEFQKLLDHKPTTWYRFPMPLAQLGLARARTLKARSSTAPSEKTIQAQGAKVYQDFLMLWKDADPDIPVLREAKTEYLRLTK